MAVANDDLILDVRNLYKYFPITKGFIFQKQVGAVKAVDGISLNNCPGEPRVPGGESSGRPWRHTSWPGEGRGCAACRNCWRSSAWPPATPTGTHTSSPAG